LGAKAEIRVADSPLCFEVSVGLVKRRAFAQDFVRNAVGTRAGHPLMAVNQYLTWKKMKKNELVTLMAVDQYLTGGKKKIKFIFFFEKKLLSTP
jgi:hypothetical protein